MGFDPQGNRCATRVFTVPPSALLRAAARSFGSMGLDNVGEFIRVQFASGLLCGASPASIARLPRLLNARLTSGAVRHAKAQDINFKISRSTACKLSRRDAAAKALQQLRHNTG
jgi:hypothetical protein